MAHTTKRKQELRETIGDLLQAGKCSLKVLERLHGLLVWFGSIVFGRKLNLFIRTLSSFSSMASRTVVSGEELNLAPRGLLKALEDSRPAKIDRCICSTWIIFSDGALWKILEVQIVPQ